MFEKIKIFFKKIFKKEEILKIEAPKENVEDFRDNIKNCANDKMRLLNLQEEIKAGRISEKNLDNQDIIQLKKLYCEQILELANSVEYYTKRLKAQS